MEHLEQTYDEEAAPKGDAASGVFGLAAMLGIQLVVGGAQGRLQRKGYETENNLENSVAIDGAYERIAKNK
jgi:hypothetical protein